MAPCGFLQPSLKEHATISTLINPGKLIGHLRVVNSGHRREPRKAAGPPRAPGSCWRERVFLKLQLIFFFLNHLEVALLFGAGKVGRWVLCFCVNPSAWPLVAPLPLRKAQLSFSSAVEEGTFLFVFCACLSVVFLSLRSSQANSEKKKKRAYVSDSTSTGPTIPSGMSIFLAFTKTLRGLTSRGQWWRLKREAA